MDDLVERARRAMEGVTEGPWIALKGAGWFVSRPVAKARREAALAVGMRAGTSLVGSPEYDDGPECEANARFIAAAPTLVRDLLRRVEEQDAEILRLKGGGDG